MFYFFKFLYLYFLYWKRKIRDRKHVEYRGFTIVWCRKRGNGMGRISIGDGCVFNSSVLSNNVGLYQSCIVIAESTGEIIIGEKSGISGSTIHSIKRIEIGENVLVGANCKIIDHDFHPIDPIERKKYIDATLGKPVKIGDNCFIGMNSIILKGTQLGKNCVVGAGSVVHGDYPDNVIIAGNPAKIIRHLS